MTDRASTGGVVIRLAGADDIAAIAAIYSDAVLNGTGTFEVEPPTLDEMAARYARVAVGGFPYLVATISDEVIGFAYASRYHARAAYRFTVEDSIYVGARARGQGIGQALLSALIERAGAGARQMVALIGDNTNGASIRLHERAGFRHAGRLEAVGWKAERWLDVVLMQRALGSGDTNPPVRRVT